MYLYFLLPYKPISKFELANPPPPTLEGRIPIGSFGTPKTFRTPQNTTCYVRLNTAFCRTANWVGKYFIVKATLSEYIMACQGDIVSSL